MVALTSLYLGTTLACKSVILYAANARAKNGMVLPRCVEIANVATMPLITKQIAQESSPEFLSITIIMHREDEMPQLPAVVPIQKPIEQGPRSGDVKTLESGARLSADVMALQQH